MQKTVLENGSGKMLPLRRRAWNRRLTKICLVMKLTTLLLLGTLFQVHAVGVAQTVNLSAKKVPMRNVLREVQKQTGYFVFFSTKELSQLTEKVQVNVEAKNVSLSAFLVELFKEQPITFELDDKTITLLRKEQNGAALVLDIPAIVVAGKVSDIDGLPVEGATVAVQGSKLATTADGQGRFRLDGVPDKARVTISAVGFMPVSLRVNGSGIVLEDAPAVASRPDETEGNTKSTAFMEADGALSIKLARLVKSIETVVVTGIFQRNNTTFTGASQTISGAELKKISANNIFTGIAAIDPAFRIVPNNVLGGSINQLPEIQIRGENSFPNLSGQLSNNPNAPLFILDGFEVSLQRIVDLDMNMINSVTLLKDASATAIYGSRGANGVMVVTTVTPKPGRMQITFNNDFRYTTPDLSVYDMLNATEKLDFEQRVGLYSATDATNQYRRDVLYNERNKDVARGVNTNWLKVPVRNGYSNRSSLYLQGGDQAVRYGIQFMGDLQTGVMKGQDRKNYSGQFDLQYLLKKVQFRNSLRVFQTASNESPYGSFSQYVALNPYWTPYDAEGRVKELLENISIPGAPVSRTANPVYNAMLHSVNRTSYFGISNNFNVRYNIVPSFFVESSLSVNRQNSGTDQFYSAQDTRFQSVADINQRGSYTARDENSSSYESLTTANLNFRTGRSQVFSTLGYNVSSSKNEFYTIVAEGFPFDRLDNLLFAAQYQTNGRPSGDESTVRRMGVVYNGLYSYDNRINAEVSLRRDGSSQYGTEKRFGNFWSTGMSWNLHNEAFFAGMPAVNNLRLRATYGSTGSLNIPAYSAQTRYNFGVNSSYYGELGAVMASLGNTALSWQEVRKLNFGLDATLLRERLSVRIDAYRERTENAITQVSLAPSTGFVNFPENLGRLENKGLEFSVRYRIIDNRVKGIMWSVNVNGFTNRNILLEISNKLQSINEKLEQANTTQVTPNILFREGESMSTIYAVRSMGVDPATGTEAFLDKDGNKTFLWSAADKVAVGIAQPKWNGNFGTNLSLKGFEMNLVFNYRTGGQLYNQTLINRVESVNPNQNVDRRAYELGWKQPGDVSMYTRITTNNTPTRLTSRFVQDENIIALTSASFGYNFFRTALLKKIGFRSLQLTAITNDLFQLTSIRTERGIDNPFSRTYSLSLRAGF